jgi:hypothetical protein
MKVKLLLGTVILAMVWSACSKDKYNTTPTITFKNVNGSEFSAGQLVSFNFEVTDKEGDIQDTIFLQRISSASCQDNNITTGYPMPETPPQKFLKADISLVFSYRNPNPPLTQLEGCSENNDTAVFKFWLKDKAGHVSDTATAPPIVLLK